MVISALVFALFILPTWSQEQTVQGPWGYTNQNDWPPICVTGRRQSPIAINTYEAMYDQSLNNLRFLNWKLNINGSLENPGNQGITWKADPSYEDTRLPKFVGGGLSGEYVLRAIHFRWALSDCDGSDHYIDYKPTPLEIQIQTQKIIREDNEEDDQTNPELAYDAMAFFSYMFEYDEKPNEQFQPLFAAVEKVILGASRCNLNYQLLTFFFT